MTTPARLWQTLESVPGLSLTLMEWQARLGEEFFTAEPLLRPTGETARSYPCPSSVNLGCRHRVVEHGPDDIMGVCPEGCPTEPIDRSDILIYEVDTARLAHMIAAALEVTPEVELGDSPAEPLRVGTYSPTAGYRFPVYLAIQMERDAAERVLTQLVAKHDGPFVLVGPTHRTRSSQVDALLEKRKACFLALCDIFPLKGQRMQVAKSAEQILADFMEAALPSPEDASGRVFFMTPPDATWEDLSIQFRDRHTVSINCKGVRGVFHYAQLDMADGRNGNPTKQWDLLLSFAQGKGRLDWKSPGASPRNKKRKEKLSAALQRFFRIEGEPIPYEQDPNGPNQWRTRFAIRRP